MTCLTVFLQWAGYHIIGVSGAIPSNRHSNSSNKWFVQLHLEPNCQFNPLCSCFIFVVDFFLCWFVLTSSQTKKKCRRWFDIRGGIGCQVHQPCHSSFGCWTYGSWWCSSIQSSWQDNNIAWDQHCSWWASSFSWRFYLVKRNLMLSRWCIFFFNEKKKMH